ncbi:hypothetical protein AB0J86_31900 [Micromonospora sp. NPDC049559]|uniref:TolB family protein n=1 Tax=Micromonospora sp. NPDC049559 TaxID=3155923 RepID=UPI00343267FF
MSAERLEQALRHLGEDLPYTNLAQGALRQSRRMRLRRNVLGGVGAVVALAAIAVPFGFVDRSAPAPAAGPGASAGTPSSATPSTGASVGPSLAATPFAPKPAPPGSVALPGGVYVASASNESGSKIYDPRQHGYRSSGHPQAWASPDGKLAVVADRNHRLGILDPATNAVRWIAGSKLDIGRPQWSGDGRQVVFAGPGRDQGTLGIVVVDVATAKARTIQPAVPCVELCQPSWLPGDTEVGLPQVSQPRAVLQAYAVADGRARAVPLPGAVQTGDAWSPDGRYVVAEISDDGDFGIGIVERATGTVTARLDLGQGEQVQARDVVWATADRIVGATARELVVYSAEGKELDRIPLPSALRGDQLQLAFARP